LSRYSFPTRRSSDLVSAVSGAVFQQVWASRGAAFGDMDNDGDIDIIVCNCNGPAYFIRNDGGNRNHWIGLELRGRKSNRDGIGRSEEHTSELQSLAYSQAGATASYLSTVDRRVLFGLGSETKVKTIEIR